MVTKARHEPLAIVTQRPIGQFAWALVGSAVWCVALVATRQPADARLGVPEWWTWLFMAVNIAALTSTSRGKATGWAVAFALQPPTVVFCLLTHQPGFVAGSAISSVLQLRGWYHHARPGVTAAAPHEREGSKAAGDHCETGGNARR